MAISAQEAVNVRKRAEWASMMEDWFDSPQSSANHLVFGMSKDQRDLARGLNEDKSVPTWV